jgi:hypothetical protein
LKAVAYADDVCVYLSSPNDFSRIQTHLEEYGKVSNAKVNLAKTEAILLSGKLSVSWHQLLLQHDTTKWHDRTSAQSLRYLGFPIISSIGQRRSTEAQLLANARTQCDIYAQRNLSLRGRVTIANTMILSQLWYVLRLVSLPKAFFSKLRPIVYQFICRGIKPSFRYATLCQPISAGGLGLLDPLIQQRYLQWRWIQQIFTKDQPTSCSQPYLKDCIRRFYSSGSHTILSLFFPGLRSPIDTSREFFLSTIYDVMDSLPKDWIDQIRCNATTLSQLPVQALFAHIPPNHWLQSRPRKRTQACTFFLHLIRSFIEYDPWYL